MLQLTPTINAKNLFIFYNSIFYVFNNFITTNIIYVILARNRRLPDDDVLTSKHVGASFIYLYVII